MIIMRAKQKLATMSLKLRSPLSGVVSMAEILSTTKLDKGKKQVLEVMLFSGSLAFLVIKQLLEVMQEFVALTGQSFTFHIKTPFIHIFIFTCTSVGL